MISSGSTDVLSSNGAWSSFNLFLIFSSSSKYIAIISPGSGSLDLREFAISKNSCFLPDSFFANKLKMFINPIYIGEYIGSFFTISAIALSSSFVNSGTQIASSLLYIFKKDTKVELDQGKISLFFVKQNSFIIVNISMSGSVPFPLFIHSFK